MIRKAGSIDVCFNAIGIPAPEIARQGMQGVALCEMSVESFALPITTHARAHFLTARAAARRMLPRRAGLILLHTPEPGRLGAPLLGGMAPAWGALETLSRSLSAELAEHGIRVVCLRSTGLPRRPPSTWSSGSMRGPWASR